jgi:Leucine Rich repeat
MDHLVHFLLDNNHGDESHEEEVVITELELNDVELSWPFGGGSQVLRDFFARSTTVTKVELCACYFGSQEEALQLLAAFETNTTVTDLTLIDIANLGSGPLGGAAHGACLSNLMQNMTQLQLLQCSGRHLGVEGVRAFQPGLRSNQSLRELSLARCGIGGDDGIRIIADSLVGNTIMNVLNISYNNITPTGLDDITRLLESTRIKKIALSGNAGIFRNEASTQRFARSLSRLEFLKELRLSDCQLGDEGIHLIVDGLVGNTIMEALNIYGNGITSIGLAEITRLLKSSKRLQKIDLRFNRGAFVDNANTIRQRHFAAALKQNTTVQELLGIPAAGELCDAARIIFARNQQLNHVNLLLAPQQQQQQQQQLQRNAGTMMLKISHKAIAKFATVPYNAGASAIF